MSLCWLMRRVLQAEALGRSPSLEASAVESDFFFDADCFTSLSVVSLKLFNNPSAVAIAVSHSALTSDVRLWRMQALTVLVSILPILVFSRWPW